MGRYMIRGVRRRTPNPVTQIASLKSVDKRKGRIRRLLSGPLGPGPRSSSGAALCDGDGADFDLAPRMRGEPAHLDGGRGWHVAAKVGGPHAVEIVLLVHVGEE